MPLPDSHHQRVLKHTRDLQVEFYLREDDLWDIDAHFKDVKPFELEITSVKIPPNVPIHNMWVRVTTDAKTNIVGIMVVFDKVPFKDYCEKIESVYQKLVGLNLLDHFRQGVRDRLGSLSSCAHINELVTLLPPVAVQVLVFGEKESREKAAFQKSGEKPFHLDRCHALRTDGPAVAKFYPEWAVPRYAPRKPPTPKE